MLALLGVLLLSSHVLHLVQSQSCDEKTEYLNDKTCCKKCKPGEFVLKTCNQQVRDTVCRQCGNGFFTDSYNNNFNYCNLCKTCTKDHMTYEKKCTTTSDAVCTCVEGYRCRDSECRECEKNQITAVSTTAPAQTIPPTNDIMWISVSLCCACVCVCVLLTCFLLISRHARHNGWIMPKSPGPWRSDKSNSGSSQCTEEEEVPMPVQEMCGKTEKLEDV